MCVKIGKCVGFSAIYGMRDIVECIKCSNSECIMLTCDIVRDVLHFTTWILGMYVYRTCTCFGNLKLFSPKILLPPAHLFALQSRFKYWNFYSLYPAVCAWITHCKFFDNINYVVAHIHLLTNCILLSRCLTIGSNFELLCLPLAFLRKSFNCFQRSLNFSTFIWMLSVIIFM